MADAQLALEAEGSFQLVLGNPQGPLYPRTRSGSVGGGPAAGRGSARGDRGAGAASSGATGAAAMRVASAIAAG